MKIRVERIIAAGAAALCLALPSSASAQSNVEPARGMDVLEAAAVARARGSEQATVVVYEIADFQCPYCAQFAQEVFPAIDSAYVSTGRVQWVFVNLPLPAHREAWPAAEAALCAGAVSGRFWEVHDVLYQRQREWSGASDATRRFADYVRAADVDDERWQQCVSEDRVAPLILQDLLGATHADISGTPTFIVNRQTRVVGVRSFEEWQEILDAALGE